MQRFGVPWHLAVSAAIVAALVLVWRVWEDVNYLLDLMEGQAATCTTKSGH